MKFSAWNIMWPWKSEIPWEYVERLNVPENIIGSAPFTLPAAAITPFSATSARPFARDYLEAARCKTRWQNVKRDTFSKSGEAKTHFSNEKKTSLLSNAMEKHLFFAPPPATTHGGREREWRGAYRASRRARSKSAGSNFSCRRQVFTPEKLFLRPHHRWLRTHTCELRARWQLSLSRQSTRFGSRRLSKQQTVREAEKRCLGEYQVSASLRRRRHQSFSLHLCALACSLPWERFDCDFGTETHTVSDDDWVKSF